MPQTLVAKEDVGVYLLQLCRFGMAGRLGLPAGGFSLSCQAASTPGLQIFTTLRVVLPTCWYTALNCVAIHAAEPHCIFALQFTLCAM